MAERLALCLSVAVEQRDAFLIAARAGGAPPDRTPPPIPTPPVSNLPTIARRTGHLPAPMTSFIGREWEIATVGTRLRMPDVRLLTLTGAGGVGKTRLALQIGSALHDAFPNGIWFVNLAPISDPALILPTIAQAIGVHEQHGTPIVETLRTVLREQQLLVLLDNFEQLLLAAPEVAALLAEVPKMKLLVTSREALHLYGEHVIVVAPLAVPDPAVALAAEQLGQYAAAQLFVARAQAADHFHLTDANAPAVAAICARLDGLPLAIELAAAQIPLFPPTALLARLDQRLPMLKRGPRDLPARQQTLRDTIDWSYALLSADEQMLFLQLSVFVGGCTITAAEAVCGESGVLADGVVDELAGLVDKSLLRQVAQDGDEPRVVMLETIRDYALKQLKASGELERARQHHTAYYRAFAEGAASQLQRAALREWLERLEMEHDNLRAALRWSHDAEPPELELRLVNALHIFWKMRGHVREGQTWIEGVLERCQGMDTLAHARALWQAADMAYRQGANQQAIIRCEESLALCHVLGDQRSSAVGLRLLGRVAMAQSDIQRAQQCFAEALEHFRRLGDTDSLAATYHQLGRLAVAEAEYERAAEYFAADCALSQEIGSAEGVLWGRIGMGDVRLGQHDLAAAAAEYSASLALARDIGHIGALAELLNCLGEVARIQGDHAGAAARYEESLGYLRVMHDRRGIAHVCHSLGHVAFHRGQHTQATACFKEAIQLYRETDDMRGVADCLEGMAGTTAAQAQPLHSARLLGAADALHAAIGVPPADRNKYERNRAMIRTLLNDATFATAWAVGHAMPLEQVITEALDH
jgi:predicted ATPase/uncharacterized protein HemY